MSRFNVTLDDLYLYELGFYRDEQGIIKKMHKKIMAKAAKALEKDAVHYSKESKRDTGTKKKHELVERKEAKSAAKDLKKRAKSAHEY